MFLVPRLYLASATRATVNVASAGIRGGSTTLQAGNLRNSGAISSDDSLQIASSGNVENIGGSLFARDDIVIDATGKVANTSGLISGENVSIRGTSVTNNTETSRDIVANGFADRMQQQARIAAHGNLLISASDAIQSKGGALEAGKDLTLQAGSSIGIGALALETSRNDAVTGGYARGATLTNTLASLSAGGNLVLDAGSNLTLAGVRAEAGGTASLQAGNDMAIAAVEDRKSQDLKLSYDTGGLFGSSGKIHDRSTAGYGPVLHRHRCKGAHPCSRARCHAFSLEA